MSCGLANEEDKGFKRHDPMCAARPLRTPFVEEGIRQVESMQEEELMENDKTMFDEIVRTEIKPDGTVEASLVENSAQEMEIRR